MRFAVAALALSLTVAWAAGAASSAGEAGTCPRDPSLGTLTFARAGRVRTVSFADCRNRIGVKATPYRQPTQLRSRSGHVATVLIDHSAGAQSQTIVVDGHAVFSAKDPVELVDWSPDGLWLLFSVDPMGSASIAADGLELDFLSLTTLQVVKGPQLLLYPDYFSWCGSTLVITAGNDRIATATKRLVTATAPSWQPHVLWSQRIRAFGSATCAPGGKSFAVLSQRASNDARFFDTKWRLWRVSLAGPRQVLDIPPKGWADESPWWSRDGRSLLFVREKNGYGQVMLWRNGTVTGPIANLGYRLGFYGHHAWWLNATWSAGA